MLLVIIPCIIGLIVVFFIYFFYDDSYDVDKHLNDISKEIFRQQIERDIEEGKILAYARQQANKRHIDFETFTFDEWKQQYYNSVCPPHVVYLFTGRHHFWVLENDVPKSTIPSLLIKDEIDDGKWFTRD